MPTLHSEHRLQIRVEQVSLVSGLFEAANVKKQADVPPGVSYLLQDISFDVCQGDRIAIVGASGAGKTSLLRLLNRLSEPTSGVIYFEQQPFERIPVIQLRRQIGLVLQESKLLSMKVQQALEYPLGLQGLSRTAIQQRVGEWLERLHIPAEWLGRTELQLSVGQRQLVAIARALVMQPRVLLLDEPTSALDVGRGEFLLNVLSELNQQHGITVLMVNHQLELAERFCDRVLHLQQGVLVQDLPKQDMDWDALRESLIAAETKQLETWGED